MTISAWVINVTGSAEDFSAIVIQETVFHKPSKVVVRTVVRTCKPSLWERGSFRSHRINGRYLAARFPRMAKKLGTKMVRT